MRRPIITFTTDFGLRDHFVGAMKGSLLSICPEAAVVDISHEVQAFRIQEGAFVIAQAYPYYPAGTIHVVVVDPGVGSSRRSLLIEAAGQYFVGPDNGVLGMVYAHEPHTAREITREEYFRDPVSRTFHGRDIFAPVAAHLARGTPFSSFGDEVRDLREPSFMKPEELAAGRWKGVILHSDRFGNLITNFHVDRFSGIREGAFELIIGDRSITRTAQTYAEMEPGEPFAIVGSSGYIEIAANQGSAEGILGCHSDSWCELTLG